jgi:hypothetical protein
MALDERSRHELYLRLAETLGPEAATTLMEHLPPVGWADVATKRDLDQSAALLRSDLGQQADRMRAEFYKTLAEQTRIIVLANIGTIVAVAGLVYGAARLN